MKKIILLIAILIILFSCQLSDKNSELFDQKKDTKKLIELMDDCREILYDEILNLKEMNETSKGVSGMHHSNNGVIVKCTLVEVEDPSHLMNTRMSIKLDKYQSFHHSCIHSLSGELVVIIKQKQEYEYFMYITGYLNFIEDNENFTSNWDLSTYVDHLVAESKLKVIEQGQSTINGYKRIYDERYELNY